MDTLDFILNNTGFDFDTEELSLEEIETLKSYLEE